MKGKRKFWIGGWFVDLDRNIARSMNGKIMTADEFGEKLCEVILKTFPVSEEKKKRRKIKCPYCGNEMVRNPDLWRNYYECLNPFCQKKFSMESENNKKAIICEICGEEVTIEELKEYYTEETETVKAMIQGKMKVVCPRCDEEGNDKDYEWDGVGGNAFVDGMVFRG